MTRIIHSRFGFINRVLERRYRTLLVVTLMFLFLPSFFFTTSYHREITIAFLSLVLVAGVYAVHTTLTNLYIGMALTSMVIVINLGGLFSDNATIQFYVGFVFNIAFYS